MTESWRGELCAGELLIFRLINTNMRAIDTLKFNMNLDRLYLETNLKLIEKLFIHAINAAARLIPADKLLLQIEDHLNC